MYWGNNMDAPGNTLNNAPAPAPDTAPTSPNQDTPANIPEIDSLLAKGLIDEELAQQIRANAKAKQELNKDNDNHDDDNQDDSHDADPKDHQAEKAKYTGKSFNRGYNYMVHWYREHPDEIGDIMFDGAKHDAEWYQQNPDQIDELVSDYCDRANLSTDNIREKFVEIEKKSLEDIERNLDEYRSEMTKYYSKSLSLFAGRDRGKYREKLVDATKKYGEELDHYLELKSAKFSDEEFDQELGGLLKTRIEEAKKRINAEMDNFINSDPSSPAKSEQEISNERIKKTKEAKDAIVAELMEKSKDRQTQQNVNFLEEYIKQDAKLEEGTTREIDGKNGGVYRKFVHNVINNKYLKGALCAAAIAGVAVTGAGLIGGTLAFATAYTPLGIALGAIKGAAGGFIGSRQDSKTSKVRGFVSEEQIKEQLESIKDAGNQDTKAVTDWLLGEYLKANRADYKSNKIRTGISMLIGAVAGGAMSGVRFNRIKHSKVPKEFKKGTLEQHTKTYLHAKQEDINAVDVDKGKGLFEVFRQMGGNDQDQSKALEIAQSVYKNHGVNFDPTGANSSGLADIYPGKIETWPAEARNAITDVINNWAKAGIVNNEETTRLISSKFITQPISVQQVVTRSVADSVKNFFAHHIAPVVLGDIAGGLTNEFGDRTNLSRNRALGRLANRKANEDKANPSATERGKALETIEQLTQDYADKILNETAPISTEEISQFWSEIGSAPGGNDLKANIIKTEKARQGDTKGRTFREWLRDTQNVDIQP